MDVLTRGFPAAAEDSFGLDMFFENKESCGQVSTN